MAETAHSFTTLRNFLALSAILCILAISAGAPPASGASESELFQKGVSSFQKGNFSAAITSLKMLLQTHPKTPLRDMTLYYLARAYVRSGRRNLGASTTTKLMQEFPATYNRKTIDRDLLKALDAYSSSRARGNSEGLMHEAAKHPARQEMERQSSLPARAKMSKPASPQAVVPRSQQQSTVTKGVRSTSRGKHRASSSASTGSPAETAKGGSFQLSMPPEWVPAEAGKVVSVPFTLTNVGATRERVQLRTQFPPLFSPRVVAEDMRSLDDWLSLGPKESFRGMISLTIPGGCADGSRFEYPLRVIPESTSDTPLAFPVRLVASAPYLRGTIRTELSPEGDRSVNCIVTVINAGSVAANDVSVMIAYPTNTLPLDGNLAGFVRRGGILVRDGMQIGSGGMLHLTIRFTVAAQGTGDSSSFRVKIFDRKLNTVSSTVSPPVALGPKGVDIVSGGN